MDTSIGRYDRVFVPADNAASSAKEQGWHAPPDSLSVTLSSFGGTSSIDGEVEADIVRNDDLGKLFMSVFSYPPPEMPSVMGNGE